MNENLRAHLSTTVFANFTSPELGAAVVISEPVKFATRVSRMVSIKASHSLSERKSWSSMTILVIRGCGEIRIDGEVHELVSGATLLVPPNCDHSIKAKSDLRLIVSFDSSKLF